MQLKDYESRVNRGAFSHRTKRLDEVITVINRYLAAGSLAMINAIEDAIRKWKQQDPKEYADRGRALERELEEALWFESSKWGGGVGKIRLVDPASNPVYEPHVWNDNGRVQFSTNCYAYACNDPYNHAGSMKPQPGNYWTKHEMIKQTRNSVVRLAVMRDDQSRNHNQVARLLPLVRMRSDITNNTAIDVANVPGYYLIALVVALGQDYHWYRQDNSGLWSHKPGHRQATDLDASGRPIVDPRECNLGIYSFTNFYYAPTGGVRTASLGDWYNPDW